MSHVPLNAIKISQALANTYPRVKVITETTSTQTEILQIFSPLQPFDLLVTEYQSQGRGRLNRTFSAPPSTSLLFSFYLQPDRNKNEWGVLPIVMGHAVAESLRKFTGLSIQTKWPNDVLINDTENGEKKIAGILCEVRDNGIIVGIGINVNIDTVDLPVPTATSLSIHMGAIVDRDKLLISIANEIHSQYEIWESSQSSISNFISHSATLDKKVRLELTNGEVKEGFVAAINHDGSLTLTSGERFTVADVTHLR